MDYFPPLFILFCNKQAFQLGSRQATRWKKYFDAISAIESWVSSILSIDSFFVERVNHWQGRLSETFPLTLINKRKVERGSRVFAFSRRA